MVLLLPLALSLGGENGPQTELADKDLKQARKLYVAKCAKCHQFYPPGRYNPKDWDLWLEKMNQKSKLKPDQADLIKRYTALLRNQAEPKPKRRE